MDTVDVANALNAASRGRFMPKIVYEKRWFKLDSGHGEAIVKTLSNFEDFGKKGDKKSV